MVPDYCFAEADTHALQKNGMIRIQLRLTVKYILHDIAGDAEYPNLLVCMYCT